MLGFVDLHPTNLTRPTKLNTPTPPPPKKKKIKRLNSLFLYTSSLLDVQITSPLIRSNFIFEYNFFFHFWHSLSCVFPPFFFPHLCKSVYKIFIFIYVFFLLNVGVFSSSFLSIEICFSIPKTCLRFDH